jgi:hypothetical protein
VDVGFLYRTNFFDGNEFFNNIGQMLPFLASADQLFERKTGHPFERPVAGIRQAGLTWPASG